MAPFTGDVHDAVFFDGIWLRRKTVVPRTNQVEHCTTLKPKLETGIKPLRIANKLKDVKDADSATTRIVKRTNGALGETVS